MGAGTVMCVHACCGCPSQLCACTDTPVRAWCGQLGSHPSRQVCCLLPDVFQTCSLSQLRGLALENRLLGRALTMKQLFCGSTWRLGRCSSPAVRAPPYFFIPLLYHAELRAFVPTVWGEPATCRQQQFIPITRVPRDLTAFSQGCWQRRWAGSIHSSQLSCGLCWIAPLKG